MLLGKKKGIKSNLKRKKTVKDILQVNNTVKPHQTIYVGTHRETSIMY